MDLGNRSPRADDTAAVVEGSSQEGYFAGKACEQMGGCDGWIRATCKMGAPGGGRTGARAPRQRRRPRAGTWAGCRERRLAGRDGKGATGGKRTASSVSLRSVEGRVVSMDNRD